MSMQGFHNINFHNINSTFVVLDAAGSATSSCLEIASIKTQKSDSETLKERSVDYRLTQTSRIWAVFD